MEGKESIVKRYKLQSTGTAYTIVVPKAWFKAHRIDPYKTRDLLVIANRDIVIKNPKDEQPIHQTVSRIVKEAKIKRSNRK